MGHSRHKTQRDQILAILISARGGWVPLPEILELAAQYGARIHELRGLGYRIENRKEGRDGKRNSYFRLVSSIADPTGVGPASTEGGAVFAGNSAPHPLRENNATDAPTESLFGDLRPLRPDRSYLE